MKISAPVYFILLLLTLEATAQSTTPTDAFDEIVKLENTDLASGVEYIEQHIIRNNRHKYLLSDQFELGSVTYNGQDFVNVPMRYNIYDDLLIVQLPHSGGESTFQLHKEKITSFSLHNRHFLRIKDPNTLKSEIDGFYELRVEHPSGLLLKKHNKKALKHLDRNFTYYEFESEDSDYVFYDNKMYYSLDSRRDVQELFPDHEKMIRQYYRANRSQSRSNHDQFLVNLFRNLLTTSHN